jgi:L-asparaginase
MAAVDPIVVLTTGGTIDKAYFDALSQYQITDAMASKLLETARVTTPYVVREVLRKDSIDLTNEDRAAILQQVQSCDASRIVITHGTDTMTLTARALAAITDKTIVLTGALSPARFAESDAAFALGLAFAAAQLAPPGRYIAINGTVFDADAVEKDRTRGCFVVKQQ